MHHHRQVQRNHGAKQGSGPMLTLSGSPCQSLRLSQSSLSVCSSQLVSVCIFPPSLISVSLTLCLFFSSTQSPGELLPPLQSWRTSH